MTDKPIRRVAQGVVAKIRAAFATIVVLCSVTLSGCAGDTPEARIRAHVDAMAEAVEAHRPADFIAHLTDDFSGEGGRLDKQQLRGFIASLMIGNKHITVLVTGTDVRLTGADRATVTIDALVTGGGYFPERGEKLTIVSGWRLVDGEWRCFRGDRQE
jgi:hypothetical protein